MRTLAPLLLLAACTTPATFGADAGRAACDHAARCDADGFDALWDDKGECYEATGKLYAGDCWIEHCDTFDTQQANACVREIRTASCDDTVDTDFGSCADAWSDCALLALGGCLAREGLDALFGN